MKKLFLLLLLGVMPTMAETHVKYNLVDTKEDGAVLNDRDKETIAFMYGVEVDDLRLKRNKRTQLVVEQQAELLLRNANCRILNFADMQNNVVAITQCQLS